MAKDAVNKSVNKFLQSEIASIAVAVLTIGLIFSYVYGDILNLHIYIIAIVFSFLLHELAHRFVARRFGCVAVFKLWPLGVVIGLIFMFARIIFVAIGAVVIYPYKFGRWKFKETRITDIEMGIIAMSGILVNLLLAGIFSIYQFWPLTMFAAINSIIALFNLIPFPPLDGSKIFKWKPWLWLFLFIIAVLLSWPYISSTISMH